MPAKVELFKDEGCIEPISKSLGELDIDNVEFYIKNAGDFVIKDLEVTTTFDAELKYKVNVHFNPGDVVKCSLECGQIPGQLRR